jgi:hypothetical protein
MNNSNIAKIEKFFTKEFFSKYKDILILQNDDGSYELFDKYLITKHEAGHLISTRYCSDGKIFASLKNAVTWCIFDNKNKIHQTNRIEYLDKMLAGTEVNILVHKKLIDRTADIEHKLIYVSKLSQEQVRKKQMIEELDDFIVQSKNWQTRKFAPK